MTTKLSCHWIRTHPSHKDDYYLSEWRPLHTKIVFNSDSDIPGLDTALKYIREGGQVIVRQHPMSENWENRGIRDEAHAREMAATHAAVCRSLWNIARQRYDVAPEQLLWTGLNEPHLWADEPPMLTAIYYEEFMRILHTLGLFAMVLNFGVGWPGNGGVTDAPPIWSPYDRVRDAMIPGDVLGLHGYWPVAGPQYAYTWLAGRHEQCPWQVPIVIGECGLDDAVAPGVKTLNHERWEVDEYIQFMAGRHCPSAYVTAQGLQHYGFHGLSPNHDEACRIYLEQLRWLDGKLRQDWRVQSAMMFTYDFSHPWSTFDVRTDEFMRGLLGYVDLEGGTAGPYTGPYIPAPQPPPPTPTPPAQEWGDPRLTPWKPLVFEWSEERQIDPLIIGTIIMLESNGQADVISDSLAVGLMQVMPFEAGDGFSDRPFSDELLHPGLNIEWGTLILRDNLNQYSNNLARALAGYYGGRKCAENLDHPDSVHYIETFRGWWRRLWDTEPPVKVGEPVPLPPDLTKVRWHAEESARELEAALALVEGARIRLKENVIKILYEHEK